MLWVRLFAWIVLLGELSGAWFMLKLGWTGLAQQAAVLSVYRSCPAEIVSSREVQVGWNSEDNRPIMGPEIVYRYAALDHWERSSQVLPLDLESSLSSERLLKAHPAGLKTVAYFNPMVPRDAFLRREVSSGPALAAMLGACLAGGAWLWFINGFLPRRKPWRWRPSLAVFAAWGLGALIAAGRYVALSGWSRAACWDMVLYVILAGLGSAVLVFLAFELRVP